ncbi:Hypothetical predicted protein [Paramuricea clavata]|uniref:Uncharacterized protein n=1 Tax=Paramuricea clavata TaxID=317549 RepID=A0A6S7HB81_PARCT|nr:Hypothetical predicted protein [Paramuricea clavata]
MYVVNTTFTILNEKNIAMSEKGNYILAVIKASESYDTLAESLADIITKMQDLQKISADDKTFDFEYFLGGDWKFLACVCGIGAGNANHACIGCKCANLDRCDTSNHWSILVPEHGAHILNEILKNAGSKKVNCKSKPLFMFIPLSHVVIDTLHLFLRISDILINLLIRELKFHDSIEKRTKFSGGFNKGKLRHMAQCKTYLQELSIPFHWYVGKESKQLEFRELTGPVKVKLFQHINISSLLPNSDNHETTPKIWDGFWNIIQDQKQDFNHEDVECFKGKVTSWLELFLTVYQAKDVTPYMHALYAQVPEFLQLYTNLEYFIQQGMEKYDVTSKNFFRSSNHRSFSTSTNFL